MYSWRIKNWCTQNARFFFCRSESKHIIARSEHILACSKHIFLRKKIFKSTRTHFFLRQTHFISPHFLHLLVILDKKFMQSLKSNNYMGSNRESQILLLQYCRNGKYEEKNCAFWVHQY